jgi:DNA-binding transcriptional ArsR family regulator
MIDEFRKQIQDRLDQLLAEADRLRRALAALGGGERSAPADPARRPTRTRTTERSGAKAPRRRSTVSTASRSPAAAGDGTSSSGSSARVNQGTRGRSTGQRSRTRAAQGQTKRAVLAALASGEAMTAGEVAAATGLGRASVSTTLSKLAKTGEVAKADRGYRRAEASSAV